MKNIDLKDVLALIGLSMLFSGLYMVSPWISLSVTGSVLLMIAFLPDILKARNGNNIKPIRE